MDIYVNPISKMGQTGSTLLKLIQNTTLPVIDMIVREGIQNSLDAALPDANSVQTDFVIGSCDRKQVDGIFKGISKALKEAVPGDRMEFLALRDKGTTGLTGPLKEADYKDGNDRGNLRKLIYEICQAQTGADKGGSWGLGKTVFFRAGIGIVMYYSRIYKGSKYEERLAATLIENDQDKDSLLRRSNLKNGRLYSGVAWWGNQDREGTDTWPLTAPAEIHKILDIFGISPYTDDETGTTVIIPYIDVKKLCADANTAGQDSVLSGWDLKEFIFLAVQRWYLPRLYNHEYKYGAYLDFRINGKKYRLSEREHFFNIMQNLYNNAETDGVPIKIQSVFEGPQKNAGFLNIKKISQADMGNNLTPHLLINKYEDGAAEDVPPIVAFCRKAGMVINYDTDGAWTSRVPHTRKGEYLVAFFVLNSDIEISGTDGLTLDNYVRGAENADHMNWFDRPLGGRPCTIVSRIQKNAAKKMVDFTRPAENENELKSDSRLQRELGKILLPPTAFGKAPYKGSGRNQGSSGHSGGKHGPDMKAMSIKYIGNNRFQLSWTIILNQYLKRIIQELSVRTANGAVIHAAEWENSDKGIGTVFPFEIENVQVVCNGEKLNCKVIPSEGGTAHAFSADTSELRPTNRKKMELCCHIQVKYLDESLICCISMPEGFK